jgi:hypothetical protein
MATTLCDEDASGGPSPPPALLAFRISALMDFLEGTLALPSRPTAALRALQKRSVETDALRLEGMYRVAGPRGELDALFAALVTPKIKSKVARLLSYRGKRGFQHELIAIDPDHLSFAAMLEVERMLKEANITKVFDCHCVSGAIKRALRKCEPLLTFHMHDLFVAAAGIAREGNRGRQGEKALREGARQLPPTSRWLLKRSLAHIAAVLAHGEDNRMTPKSIAITLGSNILRDEGSMMPSAVNCELVISEMIRLNVMGESASANVSVHKREHAQESE